MEYAQTLGVRRRNCLAGVQPADTSFNQAREIAVANLAFAAQVLGNAGIELLIEPVNTIDRIGYANWIGCEYKPSKDTYQALAGSRGTRK